MFGLKNKILGILKSIKKIENKAAFQATVACAVRVAAADGSIDDSELDLLEKLLKGSPMLANFSGEIDAEMGKWVGVFTGGGRRSATLQVNNLLEEIKNNKEQSEQVLVTIIDVADADGNIDESEVAVIRDVAARLGLDANKYGL